MKVFLSHSSADKALARRLAIDLQAAGVQVWLDQWEILVGESFEQKIAQGLGDSDFVVVLLTRQSVESNWVDREWREKFETEAKTGRVAIVPVRGEVCAIPDFLAQRSYADVSGGSYALGLRHLLETLRHYADETAVSVPDARLVKDEPSLPMLPILRPIVVEVGPALIPIFEPDAVGANRFLDELARDLRNDLRDEFGFPFPGIQVRGRDTDPDELPEQVLIMIDEVPEACFDLARGRLLTSAPVEMLQEAGISGEAYRDDVTDLARSRIDFSDRAAAGDAGFETWDAAEYVAAALRAVIRRRAAMFLDVDGVQRLINSFRATAPELVDATVPVRLSWIEMTIALQALVEEGVSIGDMGRILQAVHDLPADYRELQDTWLLIERMRQGLARQITLSLSLGRDAFAALALDAKAEEAIARSIQYTAQGPYLDLDAELSQLLLAAVREHIRLLAGDFAGIALMVDRPEIRRYVRRLFCLEFPALRVCSRIEIEPGVDVLVVARIGLAAMDKGGLSMTGAQAR